MEAVANTHTRPSDFVESVVVRELRGWRACRILQSGEEAERRAIASAACATLSSGLTWGIVLGRHRGGDLPIPGRLVPWRAGLPSGHPCQCIGQVDETVEVPRVGCRPLRKAKVLISSGRQGGAGRGGLQGVPAECLTGAMPPWRRISSQVPARR